MSYFSFLAYFIGIPLLLLGALAWYDGRQGKTLPLTLQSWPFALVVLAHVVVAVVYTTPWDNYLVATRVWWYDPNLVTGVVLGWVPVEEYTFFIVQTIFTSLWLLAVARRTPTAISAEEKRTQSGLMQRHTKRHTKRHTMGTRLRLYAPLLLAPLWLGSCLILFLQWRPGTYLALELAWALPPILFQLGFGADILWHHRRIILWTLLPTTIYLAATDTLAIASGTWTIDPAQSTGLLIGTLPVEELLFFLVTNTLVVFGTILVLAQTSQQRVPTFLRRQRATTSAQRPVIA